MTDLTTEARNREEVIPTETQFGPKGTGLDNRPIQLHSSPQKENNDPQGGFRDIRAAFLVSKRSG